LDFGKSIAFTRIRTLRRSRVGDPPPHIETSGRRYVLLIAALLLCLQAALLVYLFPGSQP
jgi:hypothetical protein